MENEEVFVGIDGYEATIKKATKYNQFIVHSVDGKKAIVKNNDIYPKTVKGFVCQQMLFLQQMVHFCESFDFNKRQAFWFRTVNCDKIQYESGVTCKNSYGSIFKEDFLALFRTKNDSIPYAFLQSCNPTKASGVHELQVSSNDNLRFYIGDGEIHEKIIKVFIDGECKCFTNKKPCYSIDMGDMYLMLNHTENIWVSFCFKIKDFIKCTDRYAYDPFQRCIFFEEKKDDVKCQTKICSPLSGLECFCILNENTFTLHRFHIYHIIHPMVYEKAVESCLTSYVSYKSMQYLNEVDDVPIQFLHWQLLFAFHMLEYVTEVKQARNQHPWNIYSEMCGTIFVAIEKQLKTNSFLNAKYAYSLLQRYPAFHANKEFVLDVDYMEHIFSDVNMREAFMSNVEYIVLAYSFIIDYTDSTSIPSKKIHKFMYSINDLLIPSLCVNPLAMNAILLKSEQRVWQQRSKDIIEKNCTIEPPFGTFYPSLSFFR